MPKLYGFEYYGGGIFVMPDSDADTVLSSLPKSGNHESLYVSEWDWRNRHGKNWLTPVKNQQLCSSCWAFAPLGTLEAYANLYFNRNVDFDLSEQELVSCSGAGSCLPGFPRKAVAFIEKNGVVDEECFPYQSQNASCDGKCDNPNERVFVEGHVNLSNYITEDSLKRLIFKFPVGISISLWNHAIVVAGYKTLSAGDRITSFISGEIEEIIVPEGSELIGKTAWLIKNSWGTSWGDNGYGILSAIWQTQEILIISQEKLLQPSIMIQTSCARMKMETDITPGDWVRDQPLCQTGHPSSRMAMILIIQKAQLINMGF